jgi:hypothetical protein
MQERAMGAPWRSAPQLLGQVVVLDVASVYVYIGRMVRLDDDCLELEDADVHDLRDTSTTREKYVLDSRLYGVRPNRRRVWVRTHEVVSISRLEDVIPD